MHTFISFVVVTKFLNCDADLLQQLKAITANREENPINIRLIPTDNVSEPDGISDNKNFNLNRRRYSRRLLDESERRSRETGNIIDIPSAKRRAYFAFNPHHVHTILGAPSQPSHLPPSEAILPGHTLLRPALGMLKSQIKFPHRELEDGAGVYGNTNNLGITYDGKQERVLYTQFRRGNSNRYRRTPADYILISPRDFKKNNDKPRFAVSNLVLDMHKEEAFEKVLKSLYGKSEPVNERIYLVVADLDKPSPKKDYSILYYNKANSENFSNDVDSDEEGNNDQFYLELQNIVSENQIEKRLLRRSPDIILSNENAFETKSILRTDGGNNANENSALKPLLSNIFKKGFIEESEDNTREEDNTEADRNVDNDRVKNAQQKLHKIASYKNALAQGNKLVNLAKIKGFEQKDNGLISMPTLREEPEKMDYKEWVKQAKHEFNTIKISQDAIEFNKFMPKVVPSESDDSVEEVPEEKRQWWFFNQVDWKPMTADADMF